MSKLDDITIGDLGRAVVRYRPYIAVVGAILMLVLLLPGNQDGGTGADITATGQGGFGGATDQQLDGEGQTSDVDQGDGTTSGTFAGGSTGTTGSGGGNATSTGGGGGSATASGGGGGGGGGGEAAAEGQMVDNCDPATGRIAIPTKIAPLCVPAFSGDNGGATYQGVEADKIKVAWYQVREDAATGAVLTAAGVNDSTEDQFQQVREWVEYYESHYQTWGRNVELHFVEGSGDATDSAAARADAIKIAEEIGAFAAMNAPNNTFTDELAARGVMCFCATSQPIENYLEWAPYTWSELMASSQGYIHRAEYTGKRLAGQKAEWAGDPLFQQQERVFGLVYYDTDDKAYKGGADFFEKHLAEEYGVRLAVKLEYHGYPNVARSQEEARPLIQKLKDAGVTSILCACDPFGPIFFTQEATRQAYRPEWVITGSALTDTSFFARTYDQTQWEHAFGISFLTARLPEELTESMRLLKWHFGREPAAEGRYGVIRAPIDTFFTGIHYTGPVLTPETFRDGMWSIPITGQGMVTEQTRSWGRHGIWPWDDYLAYDDITQIWWDPNAEGEDEVGQDGSGLYRYIDGGKRYLPTKHPTGRPKNFDPEGTVTIYEQPPASDQWPEYPSPAG